MGFTDRELDRMLGSEEVAASRHFLACLLLDPYFESHDACRIETIATSLYYLSLYTCLQICSGDLHAMSVLSWTC